MTQSAKSCLLSTKYAHLAANPGVDQMFPPLTQPSSIEEEPDSDYEDDPAPESPPMEEQSDIEEDIAGEGDEGDEDGDYQMIQPIKGNFFALR